MLPNADQFRRRGAASLVSPEREGDHRASSTKGKWPFPRFFPEGSDAIGLALQGKLANIASGIMPLWLRPFHIRDYIEIVSGTAFSGTVSEIELFLCPLETF